MNKKKMPQKRQNEISQQLVKWIGEQSGKRFCAEKLASMLLNAGVLIAVSYMGREPALRWISAVVNEAVEDLHS